MKDSTQLFADCHIGPALAIEDSGNGEALDPRLHRVDILVEEEIDHRRVVELDLIGLGVKQIALRLILLAMSLIYERVEMRIRVERDVAARPSVLAVKKRIQKVLRVRI